MASNMEHTRPQGPSSHRVYSADILPLLQSALADLADIDLAFERDIDEVRRSALDDDRKSELIASLRCQHRQRRAPYIEELTLLRDRIAATFN